jgi:hypothetical protein
VRGRDVCNISVTALGRVFQAMCGLLAA